MMDRLLSDIDAFLARHAMAPSYFGKLSCGNSELVARLRAGGEIMPSTESRIRAFMDADRRPLVPSVETADCEGRE